MTKIDNRPFEKLYFLTHLDNGKVEYQGQILKDLGDGNFLCEKYSWLTALPNGQVVVNMSEMKGWKLSKTSPIKSLYDEVHYLADGTTIGMLYPKK
jgi:hypothetical protein